MVDPAPIVGPDGETYYQADGFAKSFMRYFGDDAIKKAIELGWIRDCRPRDAAESAPPAKVRRQSP